MYYEYDSRRECDNCGTTSSEHSYCAACDRNICAGCDHTCKCRDCNATLDAKGVCVACETFAEVEAA